MKQKKSIITMNTDERENEFGRFVKGHDVKSYARYVDELKKAFSEIAPISKHRSIYEISDPEELDCKIVKEKLEKTRAFTRQTQGGTAARAGFNWYLRFLRSSKDSYYAFMDKFDITPQKLFEWGYNATIFPDEDKTKKEWEDLKNRIKDKKEVYIRGYGRDGNGTGLFCDFYNELLGIEVKRDPNNNNRPKLMIQRTTDRVRNKDIFNYQISHIWGRTKNIYLFEAPWNICYTPKIIDPFTGHETKGDLPKAFKEYFLIKVQKKYGEYIDEYNEIIRSLEIEAHLEKYREVNKKFYKDATHELSTIPYFEPGDEE